MAARMIKSGRKIDVIGEYRRGSPKSDNFDNTVVAALDRCVCSFDRNRDEVKMDDSTW